MKKIFTLIATALMAVGASAQTTIFNAADDGWSATGVNLTTGTTTVGDVTWYGRGSAAINSSQKTFDDTSKWTHNLKTGGSSTFQEGSNLAGVLVYTPTKDGKITVYAVGGGDSARKLHVSQSIGSSNRDESTSLGSIDGANKAAGYVTVTVEANKAVYVWATNSMLIYAMTFEEAEVVAVDPVFTLTKTSINQYQSSQIVVNGKSGLDGLTMTGLSYNDDVISINGFGQITPKTAGTTTITFTTAATEKYNAGSANLTIEVTEVTLDEPTTVTEDATWDWSKFGTSKIELTDETTPAKTDEIVLSNVVKYGYCDAIGSEFGNAQALKVIGQYPVNSGYFQGSSIKFTTNRAGKVSVTYSNTGNRENESERRFLTVNGTQYGEGTMNTTMMTTSDIDVPAGEVAISGCFKDDTANSQYLRISKIVFTATGEPEDITGINTVATDAAKANVVKKYVDGKQVVIEKNGKKYNVAGAQIK